MFATLLIAAFGLGGCGVSARYQVRLDQQEQQTRTIEKNVADLQVKLAQLEKRIANAEVRLNDLERYLTDNAIGKATFAPVTPVRLPKKGTENKGK